MRSPTNILSQIDESPAIQGSPTFKPKSKSSIVITKISNRNAISTPIKSPFKIIACKRSVGRAKGKKENAVDFKPPKRKEKRPHDSKMPKAKRAIISHEKCVTTTYIVIFIHTRVLL